MAGLFDGLGAPQQGLGFMGRAQSFREQNPGALTAIGAGLMNGNLAQGFAHAAPVIAQGRRQNATAQYLMKKGLAQTPEEAMELARNPLLLADVMKGDDLKVVGKRIYNATKNTWLDDPMAAAGGNVDYSQVPQLIENPDGSYGMVVLGDNATVKQIEMPKGAKLLGPFGTSRDKAEGGVLGEGSGKAKDLFISMTTKMPALKKTVMDLGQLSKTATYTPAGKAINTAVRWADLEPSEAAIARAKYMAKVNTEILPLLTDTFGPQFTVAEGERLRSTLGDDNASPQEKQAVLDAFIEQKYSTIQSLALRTGQAIPEYAQPTIQPPAGNGGWTVKKVSP